jgi:hypothetical protein
LKKERREGKYPAMKEEGKMADYVEDYFLCDSCENKDFKRIYNFSLRFHGVNFSDDLIYDKLTHEIYQCTRCHKTFSMIEIMEGLAKIKARRKEMCATGMK